MVRDPIRSGGAAAVLAALVLALGAAPAGAQSGGFGAALTGGADEADAGEPEAGAPAQPEAPGLDPIGAIAPPASGDPLGDGLDCADLPEDEARKIGCDPEAVPAPEPEPDATPEPAASGLGRILGGPAADPDEPAPATPEPPAEEGAAPEAPEPRSEAPAAEPQAPPPQSGSAPSSGERAPDPEDARSPAADPAGIGAALGRAAPEAPEAAEDPADPAGIGAALGRAAPEAPEAAEDPADPAGIGAALGRAAPEGPDGAEAPEDAAPAGIGAALGRAGVGGDAGSGGAGALPPIPGEQPLKRADIPALDRRVLTLPGAVLAVDPIAGGDAPLPAFSVFYVYGEHEEAGTRWLQIGRSAAGRIDGWVRAEDTEAWKTMLVMDYAPKGGRDRVLFFKRREDLVRFVRDPHVGEEAAYARQAIEEGAYRGDFFVAIEPAAEVDPNRPYLMPILDHAEDMFDSLEEVTLVEVAGLNLEGRAAQGDVSEGATAPAAQRSAAFEDFRYGIVFAIDTTSSMGRYIDHTRGAVFSVMDAFARAGLADKVDFGLVGYRDNTRPNPAIEYVTRIYQPLSPGAEIAEVLANFERMAPVGVSTQGFDEDAFAGLDAAINGMRWDGYGFRMVVLITDAGARPGTDPLVANPGYDALNVVENAERRGVALSVLHLLTPEGRRAGNIAPAASVYSRISATGDRATRKYFPVDTTRPDAFVAAIRSFSEGLVGAVAASAEGARVARRAEVETVGDALVNEVFRAQLEYLGAAEGQAAPRFYRAWAADRDFADPRLAALEVKVFLTRQQLSAMMEGAEAILAAYERQETGGRDFFAEMRAFSAQSAVEGAGSRAMAEAGALFPAFLAALPYRSDFLELTPESWAAGGPSRQRELTEALRNKLRAYRDIAASEVGWIDLGAGSRAEDVYAVGLGLLP